MDHSTSGADEPASTILALDLGKFKSVAAVLEVNSGSHRFETIVTSPAAVAALLESEQPDRLVIEACSIAGWVADLARSMSIPVQVANANSAAWQWKKVKRKTDRDDALKLAKLSMLDQLPTVHVPQPAARQWKGLIKYRHSLVDRRTGIKNTIRSLLDSQGIGWPARSKGWTAAALAELKQMGKPLTKCSPLELWRGELAMELMLLERMLAAIAMVDKKLDQLQRSDVRVARLRPGICKVEWDRASKDEQSP